VHYIDEQTASMMYTEIFRAAKGDAARVIKKKTYFFLWRFFLKRFLRL
jgi:hypothetical protein